MPRLPHRSLVLTACLVTSITLAACSSDSETSITTADDTLVTTTTAAEKTTTTDPPPPTTAAALTPEQEVEAAYREAFDEYFKSGGSPQSPNDLQAHFAGDALVAVARNVDRLASQGLESRFPTGPPTIEVAGVVVHNDGSATLTGCVIDTGHKVVVATGAITDNTPTSRSVSAHLNQTEAGWRVVAHETTKEWQNADGCDQ